MKTTLLTLALSLLLGANTFSCSNPEAEEQAPAEKAEPTKAPTNRVKLSSEIDWEALNPARGDQSPQGPSGETVKGKSPPASWPSL